MFRPLSPAWFALPDHRLATVLRPLSRRTTPDFFDVNKYASEGDFPGSFRIPGTRTSFQIGGFVQLDAKASKWGSTAGYSFVNIDNVAGEAGTDCHRGQYAIVNLRVKGAVEKWEKAGHPKE